MTADRFGAIPSGEYTALASVRDLSDRRSVAPPEVVTVSGPAPLLSAAPDGGGGARGRPAADRWWRPVLPPQHGAWAFLVVPVLCGFAVAGASPAGWLLLGAWLSAYPVGYYLGRALTARHRRGGWTRLARRELIRAVPWAALTGALGLALVVTRPWLVAVALVLAVLWGLGLRIAARRGERSLANDLMLVAQAAAALPLAVAVVAGRGALTSDLLGATVQATLVVAAYLAGSVLHVKSLIREAGRPGYRRASIGWHVGLAVGSTLASPWWLVGTVPALVRSVGLRPGLRPGVIGGVEAVVAALVVVAAFLAV